MKLQYIGKKLAIVSAVAVLSAAAAMTAWAKTRLDTVTELYWNEDDDSESKMTEARWEAVDDAYQYEVYLYRDGSKVGETTVKASKTSYNFKRKMDKEGDYTFRVRALAKKNDKEYSNSSWSEDSEGLYISAARADYNKNGREADTSTSGPGMPKDGSTAESSTGSSGVVSGSSDSYNSTPPTADNTDTSSTGVVGNATAENSTKPVADSTENGNAADSGSQQDSEASALPGEWKQDNVGWWYCRADGTYPVSAWFQDPADGKYYMFDSQGYMRTGWIDWNDNRYYCDPDGTPAGAMVTGDLTIKGVLYHFEESGAMKDDLITSGGSSSSDDEDD